MSVRCCPTQSSRWTISLLGELVELYDETAAPSTMRMFSSLFLPSRYADLYDFALMRRLRVCLVVVAGRLQDRWEPPRCRGEELVLRAVIDHAETCLHEEADEPSDGFGDLREWLFEDLDHEYLFNPAFDGIDDPDTFEGSQLGVASLHPCAWCEPFRTDVHGHPLLAGRSGTMQRADRAGRSNTSPVPECRDRLR